MLEWIRKHCQCISDCWQCCPIKIIWGKSRQETYQTISMWHHSFFLLGGIHKELSSTELGFIFRLYNLKDHRELGALMQHEGIYDYRLANSHDFVASLMISWPIFCSHELASDFSCTSGKSNFQKILELPGPFPSLIDIK